jgi:hypothetical protein
VLADAGYWSVGQIDLGREGRAIPLVQRPLRELTLLWHGQLVQRVTDPQEPVT